MKVHTEDYIYGRIMVLKGVYIHLKNDAGGIVKIKCLPADILAQKESNHIGAHIRGIKDLDSGKMLKGTLVRFLPYNPYSMDMKALKKIQKAGTAAFKDIKNPVQWVRNLRE